jgi:hypothetical protein
MIFTWSTAVILVPLKHWKKSWPVGIFGMTVIYVIDGTLISLGAFRFRDGVDFLSGLPLYYWLGYFPGGILFDNLRPKEHFKKLIYIISFAAAYLFVEIVTIYLGYFRHLNWNAYNSLLLNVVGFTVTMWFAEWIEAVQDIRKKV